MPPTPEPVSPSDAYIVTGVQANEATTDAVPIDPFSTVTITNPANSIGTATVTIPTYNGVLSNLGTGTLDAYGTTYTVTGTPAAIQAALQGLVFTPTNHQVPYGQTVDDFLTLSVADGASTVSGGQTEIVVTAVKPSGVPVLAPAAGGPFNPLLLNDQQTATLIPNATLSDPNAGAFDTVTLTLTQNTELTDAAGTLSGAGLTRTGVGTYQLAAGTPAAVQAELDAIVFTPATVTTDRPNVVHVGLQVADGVVPPVSTEGPDIETFDQALVLDTPGATANPNPGGSTVITNSETDETATIDTPVDALTQAYATTISATLDGGQTVFSQTFSLPYSDPTVQAAVARADAALAADNAIAAAPTLAASQVTNLGTQTAVTQTGSSDVFTVDPPTTIFGPAIVPEANAAIPGSSSSPSAYFQINAGQTDINVHNDDQITIDQTVTTTGTVLTTQSYVIAGTTPSGPVLGQTTNGLFINDQQTPQLFPDATLSDSNSGALDTVTLTLTQNTALTDAAGTLSGAGLTHTGVGTYQLAAGTPSAVQSELDAIVFTPTAVTTDTQSVVHVGLQVADGVVPPVSSAGPGIEIFDQALVLSTPGAFAATNPGGATVVTSSATDETATIDTPVDDRTQAYATTISATLDGGQTVFSQTFALPYSDPTVQAAVAQADAVLAADNAIAAAPTLAASQVTNVGTQTAVAQTGSTDSATVITSSVVGPAILGPGVQVGGSGNSLAYFQVNSGQTDINVDADTQTTIDQTVTTTGTVLTTQSYVIAGTSTLSGGGGSGSVSGGNGTLPDVSASFTSAVYATLLATLTGLMPSGGTPHVVSVGGGASAGAAVSGTLNAYVDTLAAAGATDTITAGYAAGYLLGGTGDLLDTGGGAILIDATAGASLTGTANDTLFGGNSGATLFATTGAETLIGGTGTNAFFLGSSTGQVLSQGNDIITGSSVAETVSASGSLLYFGTSGATDLSLSGTGGDTIIGGNNGNTVQGGGGAQLIFGSSSLDYTGGAGAATIIGGGGGNTVTGGSGNLLLFASSSMTYTGTGGAATVIGGGGPLTAALGSGGGVAYGSPGGGDALSTASSTQSILVGGGQGDVITATGSGADILVAGGGAETINGSGDTGNLVIFGGSGNDVLMGGTGNDLIVTEPGNETLTGGGGSDNYIVINFGATTRTDVFTDFDPSHNAIGLYGYGAEPAAGAAALASATTVGGNTVMTLPDGTSLVFVGAPTLSSYNFF